MTEHTIIVQKLLDTGWHFSMDTSNFSLLIRKLVVLSLKYIDKKKIWDILFPENEVNHVDWSLVKPDFNALSDLFFWLPVIEQCHWNNVAGIEHQHIPIHHMKNSLRKAGLDTSDYDLACQLLILHLMQGIPVLYAFEMLTCRYYKRNTHQASAILLANLSDILHTPEEYEKCLVKLLHTDFLQINTDIFQKHLDLLREHQNQITTLAAIQNKNSISSGRPRLRDLLEQTDKDKVQMDTRLGTWESFPAFCQLHQFPNILSEIAKQKIYFLASQTRWSWAPHVKTVIGHQGDICEKVAQYPVTKPDLSILHICIQRLNMNGRPPFKELISFKNRCFVNFPLTQFQNMNLNQFLRLYVCIYQNENVWKDLWRMQGILYSPHIIRDCENFVHEQEFNDVEFHKFFHS
jgi:hypothetical protein